jgi:hypothetical protein
MDKLNSAEGQAPRQAPGTNGQPDSPLTPPCVLPVGARWATPEGEQWGSLAFPLARAVVPQFLNTFSHHGGYNSLRKRGTKYVDDGGKEQEYGKVTTRKKRLDFCTVLDHFEAGLVGPGVTEEDYLNLRPTLVVGPHAANEVTDTSKWTTAEVDAHAGPTDNEGGIVAIYEMQRSWGFPVLLWGSDDKGGFHDDLLFAYPIPTYLAFAVGAWMKPMWQKFGLPKPFETFPKQPFVAGRMPFGSWCRMIGPHHSKNIWPPVWDGKRWLRGTEAALYVIELLGKGGGDPKLLPKEILDLAAEILAADRAGQDASRHPRGDGEPRRPKSVRVEADYGDARGGGGVTRNAEGKIEDGHGRRAFLNGAAFAMRQEGLDYDAIIARLRLLNAENCDPPKHDADLVKIARDICNEVAKGVKKITVSFGLSCFYVFRADDPPAELVAGHPDLVPVLDGLKQRAQAGEDVAQAYADLGKELQRRRDKVVPGGEIPLAPWETPEQRAELRRMLGPKAAESLRQRTPEEEAEERAREKMRREGWAGQREQRHREEEAKKSAEEHAHRQRAEARWGPLRAWVAKFRHRHSARHPRCGRMKDHLFESAGDRCVFLVGTVPCGSASACDFCFGRRRTLQVACVVACLYRKTPFLGSEPDPDDPDAAFLRYEAIKDGSVDPDSAAAALINFCRPFAVTDPAGHRYHAVRLYSDDDGPEKWKDEVYRDPAAVMQWWTGTVATLEAAEVRLRRAVDDENGRRFGRGERPLAFGGARFCEGNPHDPKTVCHIVSEVMFAGTRPVSLADSVKEVIRLGDTLPRYGRVIERLKGWRKLYAPKQYRDRGAVAEAAADTPDDELGREQVKRYKLTYGIVKACGCKVIAPKGAPRSGTFLPEGQLRFEAPAFWRDEERELLIDYLGNLREPPPMTLDKLAALYRAQTAAEAGVGIAPQGGEKPTPRPGSSAGGGFWTIWAAGQAPPDP